MAHVRGFLILEFMGNTNSHGQIPRISSFIRVDSIPYFQLYLIISL